MHNPKKNIINYTSQINKGLKFFVKNFLSHKSSYLALCCALILNSNCAIKQNISQDIREKQTLESKLNINQLETKKEKLNLKNTLKFKPYIGIGTLSTKEKNHQKATGHKVMTIIGVNMSKENKFKKEMTLEYGAMAEPVDDDTEMIHDYLKFNLKGSYHNFLKNNNVAIYPIIELGGEWWRRNSPEGDDVDKFFGDLYFLEICSGIGIKNKNNYLEAKGIFPILSDTDSGQKPNGKLGFIINAGKILNEKFDFKAFYEKTRFNEDLTQTPFELNKYGCSIGFIY